MDPTYSGLDRFVADAEAAARAEGWTGDWTPQVGDLDALVQQIGRKLTAKEGEYLDIPRWANAHVHWAE